MSEKHNINTFRFQNPERWEKLSIEESREKIKFLEEIIEIHNCRDILDVGCGSGYQLHTLCGHGSSKSGRRGTGIDLNEAMIRYAKEKYKELSFDIQDMRTLEYNGSFDLIYSLDQTFNFNTNNRDMVRTLQTFCRALKNGGLMVLELFNPIIYLQKKEFQEIVHKDIKDYETEGYRSLLYQEINEIDQTITATRRIFAGEELISEDINLYRLCFPQEMVYFLETTGFTNIELFGGFSPDKQNNLDSNIFIIKGEKT